MAGLGGAFEAHSILLPKGWRTEGQVAWVINTTCPADAAQNRVTASSPDGAFELEVFPQRSWQWYDDPMLLQNAMNNAVYQASGVNLESRPSAHIGRLQWMDGRIGIVLCAVEQTMAYMPNLMTGGNYASYQCRAERSSEGDRPPFAGCRPSPQFECDVVIVRLENSGKKKKGRRRSDVPLCALQLPAHLPVR